MWIFPKILATITRYPRQKVTTADFKWSKNSWVHNIMRSWELIFGRKCSSKDPKDTIRHEMSSMVYKGKMYYACYSWESAFALAEQYIRSLLKVKIWIPVKIYIPVLATPQGINFPAGYMFAIALDTSANHDSTNFTYTCTGSNLILVAGIFTNSGDGYTFTGITYNSVAMSNGIDNNQTLGGANQHCWLWYLIAPATGGNTISCQSGLGASANLQVASYTGAKQSAQPDATAVGQATSNATSVTAGTLTVVAANSWVVAFVRNRIGANDVTNNSGVTTTSRSGSGAGPMYWDSNGVVSTGSNTVSFAGNNQTWNVVTMSIAPATAAATYIPAIMMS